MTNLFRFPSLPSSPEDFIPGDLKLPGAEQIAFSEQLPTTRYNVSRLAMVWNAGFEQAPNFFPAPFRIDQLLGEPVDSAPIREASGINMLNEVETTKPGQYLDAIAAEHEPAVETMAADADAQALLNNDIDADAVRANLEAIYQEGDTLS